MSNGKKTNRNTGYVASVLEGLEKCRVCGEYKGRVKCKDLNWAHVPFKERYEENEELLRISCWCESVICPHCGKGTVRRPTTNYYVEQDNRIIHVPYFRASFGCSKCGFLREEGKAATESTSGEKIVRPRIKFSMPLRTPPSHCIAPQWYLTMSRAELKNLFNYERIPEHERQRYENAFDRYYEMLTESSSGSDEHDRFVEEFLAESAVAGCLPEVLERIADLAARLWVEKQQVFPPHEIGGWW